MAGPFPPSTITVITTIWTIVRTIGNSTIEKHIATRNHGNSTSSCTTISTTRRTTTDWNTVVPIEAALTTHDNPITRIATTTQDNSTTKEVTTSQDSSFHFGTADGKPRCQTMNKKSPGHHRPGLLALMVVFSMSILAADFPATSRSRRTALLVGRWVEAEPLRSACGEFVTPLGQLGISRPPPP